MHLSCISNVGAFTLVVADVTVVTAVMEEKESKAYVGRLDSGDLLVPTENPAHLGTRALPV